MAITALDTHQTVKDLTAAGFSDAQAEALTGALRRVQDIDLSNLANKADLAELRTTTKSDIAELRTTTKSDIAELRTTTKSDFAELRAATKADIAEVRREIAEMKTELIKWMVGMAFAMVGAIVTIQRMFPGGHP